MFVEIVQRNMVWQAGEQDVIVLEFILPLPECTITLHANVLVADVVFPVFGQPFLFEFTNEIVKGKCTETDSMDTDPVPHSRRFQTMDHACDMFSSQDSFDAEIA